MTCYTYNAQITGVGPDSTVPENPDAVDATVYFGGRGTHVEMEVTLLPDPRSGKLVTWGGPENWCSRTDLLELDDCDAIVQAVRDALAYELVTRGDPPVWCGHALG